MNYVMNSSLEEHSQCPSNYDQIHYASFWSGIDSFGNISCTPEYCHTCGSMGIVTVPWCTGGYQYPRTGSALATNMALFDEFVFDTYRRSYLQGRLSETLISGMAYCVSFYVSLSNLSRYAIKEYSAYLDDGSIDTVSNCGLPQTQIIPTNYQSRRNS